ncbi:glucan phosphoethanolaminetransferase (alkaline phosphatase superfamily) [Staphylococcus hominis]
MKTIRYFLYFFIIYFIIFYLAQRLLKLDLGIMHCFISSAIFAIMMSYFAYFAKKLNR